ncbi:unnamed protein product, partial [Prorocentrum cordatum]
MKKTIRSIILCFRTSGKKIGEEVQVTQTMKELVAKFSSRMGWIDDVVPAAFLVDFISKYVESEAVDNIQSRAGGTVTFMCHQARVDTLLRASGAEGVFIKKRNVDPLELLWLPEDTSLKKALDYASKPDAMGLAEKGKTGRLAIRFEDEAQMEAFARKHNIDCITGVGRWKVTGLPVSMGTAGMIELLMALRWEVKEILYYDAKQTVFLAQGVGNHAPSHFLSHGQPRSIEFKAPNAAAKKAAEESARASRDPAPSTGATSSTRAARQLNFFNAVQPASKAYVALIPKDPTFVEPAATDWPGRSAEAMAMSIAMDMEAVAYGAGEYVGGISYDFKKAFDLIPMEIALQLLVRTVVMQALWKTDNYSMSPAVTFAILAPVYLDPEFAAAYEGLRTVMRTMRNPEVNDAAIEARVKMGVLRPIGLYSTDATVRQR